MTLLYIIGIIQFVYVFSWISGESNLKFPEEFKIGVGGSAYQTEGAWNIDGKSPSNWDVFSHNKNNSIVDGENGDVATDSYHKYKEDIKILKDTGFQFYRLSLSWSRILPAGVDNITNNKGIQHYKNVLDELHKNGIEPFVTIYHWDHPDVLDQTGGWLNETIVDHFVNYAKIVFQEFGSRVKFWTTINEPIAYCYWGYGKGAFPIGKEEPSLSKAYRCGYNMLQAHAKVYHLYNDTFRINNSQIGIVNSCWNFYSIDKNDTESSDIAFQYNCGWLSHPIFTENGDYPDVMIKRINENSQLEGLSTSRLPILTPQLIQEIKNTADYFGLNYYTSRISESIKKSSVNGWFEDSGIKISENKSWPVDSASWLQIVPKGLGDLLRKIKNEYNNPPIYILGNGLATDLSHNDTSRINYLYSHMEETLLAINRDGCNIKGYTVWSLLDNFEWLDGYTKSYGIVHVDHQNLNRPRSPRLSVTWLKEILKNRQLMTLNDIYNSSNYH
ncbi:myrosinase 1-like [Aphidius gifuensis]|uniref:myrosinase 1-like n=1 Tax=Aphidius gifuensis TaxID=684658 RepID=UPI001CDC0861|nr:myrosinase 1-like [Aphidius gifuensis]